MPGSCLRVMISYIILMFQNETKKIQEKNFYRKYKVKENKIKKKLFVIQIVQLGEELQKQMNIKENK